LFLVGAVCAASIGCGGESLTAVSGVVTYDGKPVTRGLVNFRTPGGRPLGGGINSDGSYQFDAPPGEYQVLIDSPEEFAPASPDAAPSLTPISPRQVPTKYAGFESSGLTATVSAESSSQQIDFNLP